MPDRPRLPETPGARALHRRLRAVDPGRARLGNALLTRFHHRLSGGLLVQAEANPPPPLAWLPVRGEGVALALAPRLAAGRPVPAGDCAATLLAALGAMEPLLDLVERQFGALVEAADVVRALPPALVPVRLVARDMSGLAVHELWVASDAAPPGRCLLPAEPTTTRWIASAAFVDLGWVLPGPSLSLADAAGLRPGDLLLLGAGPPEGALVAGGRRVRARLAAADRLIIVEEETGAMEMPDMGPDIGPHRGVSDTAADLPLVLRVAAGRIGLAEAAVLRPGQVLPLPLAGASLPVAVEAGGARVATGELVALGDGYGVLLTAVVTANGGAG
jgi:flagellar motor switch/type III secretory pathway protein FliN